jgi:glycosyltransferase involved in cell wall biosynthesis
VKKVLIITYYWVPAGGGGVQRWVKFAKYFRDFGWEPVIYTVSNGDYPLLDPSLAKNLPEGIEVIRTPIWEPYDFYNKLTGKKKGEKIDANFLSQGKKLDWKKRIAVWIRGNFFIPDARCFWIEPSVKYLSKYLQDHKIDAIISTGPPHTCHRIGYGIKKKYNLPWIVDYRDPWTQIDFYDELNLSAWADRKHKRMEKEVLDTCDIITPIGKTMKEDLHKLTNTRVEVVTNGYDEEDKKQDEAISLDEKFSIVYVGTMNNARDPKVMWNALNELKKEGHELFEKLEVRLVGGIEASVFESIRNAGLDSYITHIKYLPHDQVLKMQNKAQILLLVINDTWNAKSILTGKIFEYIASNRPVLCIGPHDGDAAEIINTSGAGIVIDYKEVAEMKKVLTDYYAKYKTGSLTIQASGIEKYSRRALTGRMSGLLNEISK